MYCNEHHVQDLKETEPNRLPEDRCALVGRLITTCPCLCVYDDDPKSEMSDAIEQLMRMFDLGEYPKFNVMNIYEDVHCGMTVTYVRMTSECLHLNKLT